MKAHFAHVHLLFCILRKLILGMTTTELPQITTEWSLPVYGLGDYRFNLIHITGLVTLAISILVSFGVLLYTLVLSGKGSLWKRPVGERLVVYLAACDLAWSISHTMDHAYMLAIKVRLRASALQTAVTAA